VSDEIWIELRGLRVSARIGVTDAELELERELVIDIDLIPQRTAAVETDELSDTLDYARVAELAERTATSGPHRTLERLGARIAEVVIVDGGCAEVGVRVAKPDPPTAQAVDSVAVRIARSAE
jgi:dihydroneopterin aldolase